MDTKGNIRPARHPKPINCSSKCRNKCHERIADARREAVLLPSRNPSKVRRRRYRAKRGALKSLPLL